LGGSCDKLVTLLANDEYELILTDGSLLKLLFKLDELFKAVDNVVGRDKRLPLLNPVPSVSL
jgi:hypothetical protein